MNVVILSNKNSSWRAAHPQTFRQRDDRVIVS
jgi:hypothetical protein